MSSNDEKKRYTLTFAELVGALPGIAAIGGAVVYGVLTAAYSEYYAELGVRPSEVGLEFGPGLGGLAGVTVVLIGLLTLQVGATLLYLRFIPEPPRIPRFKLWVLGINLVLVGALFMIFFSRQANERADDAKDGIPVEPYRFLGLEILSLRADLAEVSLAAPKSEESEAYTRVRAAEKLLYLGRSEGSIVLYEPGVQSSWRLPASVFAVRALNCETKKDNKDPACP